MLEKDPLTEPWKQRGMDQLCSKLHPEADKGCTDAGDRLPFAEKQFHTENRNYSSLFLSVRKPAHRGIRLGWSHPATCSQFNFYSMKRAKSSFRLRSWKLFLKKREGERKKKCFQRLWVGKKAKKKSWFITLCNIPKPDGSREGKQSEDKYGRAWIETQRDPVIGMQFLRSSAPLTLWASLNLVRWLSSAPSVERRKTGSKHRKHTQMIHFSHCWKTKVSVDSGCSKDKQTE